VARDGGHLVDKIKREVFAKPPALPGLAVAPEKVLRGAEQWCRRSATIKPGRLASVHRGTGLERAGLGKDVERKEVVNEDVADSDLVSGIIGDGSEGGVPHLRTHESDIRIWAGDNDVAGAYVCTLVPVIRSMHKHGGTDAPQISFGSV